MNNYANFGRSHAWATGQIFVQNAQSHPCDLGWLIRPFYFVGVFDLSHSLLDFPRNPPDDTGLARFGRLSCKPLASTALALGWGSIGSTPLKEPLGTGAGKCYLVFDPILVEDELSLGIGYLKLFDT